MDDKFKRQLREIALANRANGQMEMRIAAMRFLETMGSKAEARAIGALDVDVWLTPSEIAKREQMP